jgi:hypothetical protein
MRGENRYEDDKHRTIAGGDKRSNLPTSVQGAGSLAAAEPQISFVDELGAKWRIADRKLAFFVGSGSSLR